MMPTASQRGAPVCCCKTHVRHKNATNLAYRSDVFLSCKLVWSCMAIYMSLYRRILDLSACQRRTRSSEPEQLYLPSDIVYLTRLRPQIWFGEL